MNERVLILVFRAGAGFVITLHAFVSLGLFLQGALTMRMAILGSDHIYGAVLAFMGLLFAFMAWDAWRRVFGTSFPGRVSEWRQGVGIRKTGVTAGIFLMLFLFRYKLHSMILFVGFEAGAFFVQSAGLAYSRSFGIGLGSIGLHHFAWVYQWHFVDHIVRMVWGFIERRRRKGKVVSK